MAEYYQLVATVEKEKAGIYLIFRVGRCNPFDRMSETDKYNGNRDYSGRQSRQKKLISRQKKHIRSYAQSEKKKA